MVIILLRTHTGQGKRRCFITRFLSYSVCRYLELYYFSDIIVLVSRPRKRIFSIKLWPKFFARLYCTVLQYAHITRRESSRRHNLKQTNILLLFLLIVIYGWPKNFRNNIYTHILSNAQILKLLERDGVRVWHMCIWNFRASSRFRPRLSASDVLSKRILYLTCKCKYIVSVQQWRW